MAKVNIMDRLYNKRRSADEFMFDAITIPPMRNYIPQSEINKLHKLVSSVRYSSNLRYKTKEIDKIMRNLGFKRYHSGTNRVVYSYLEDTRFLAKIALDRVGLKDNPLEYKNQFFLKPFVTKIFEISSCGTVALVERVDPITSIDEFKSMSNEIYDFLLDNILGEYVVEDVGCEYFMNWGIRKNFGPVLLDYTYVYKLDGNKLVCKNKNPDTGEYCNGIIDYDDGFNNLVCEKCGKIYFAQDLEDKSQSKRLEIIKEEERTMDMKFSVNKGNKVLFVVDSTQESNNIINSKKKVDNKSFNSMFELVRDDEMQIDAETGEYITSIVQPNIISNHILSDEEVNQIRIQQRNMDIDSLGFNECMNMIITDMPDESEIYGNRNNRETKDNDEDFITKIEEKLENIEKQAQNQQDDDIISDLKSEIKEVRQELKEGFSDIKGKIVNTVNELKDTDSEVTIGNILKDKLLSKTKVEEDDYEEEGDVEEVEETKESDNSFKYERVTIETLKKHLEKDNNKIKDAFDEEVLSSIVTETIEPDNNQPISNTEVIETVDIEDVEPVEEYNEENSIDLEEDNKTAQEDYISKETIAKLFEDDTYENDDNVTAVENKNNKQEKKKGKYNAKNYSVDDNKFYSNFTGGKKGNNKKNIFKKY